MRNHSLFTILLIFCSVPLFATTFPDSIGVENNSGKEVVLHKIEPKETYYSLGRKYNVAPKTISDFNASKGLQPGMIVKVPTNRPFAQPTASVQQPAASTDVIEYTVGRGETLYSIARRLGSTVEEIKSLNKMSGNALQPGQSLKVKSGVPQQPASGRSPIQRPAAITPENVPETPLRQDTSASAHAETDPVRQNRYGLRQHEDRGVAVWIADENVDGTKMLALHNSLPSGTIVKVTNPMSGKSTFVKVIGRFTENESTKDVIIVFTKAVADVIGAIDKRFQVSITYGVASEN